MHSQPAIMFLCCPEPPTPSLPPLHYINTGWHHTALYQCVKGVREPSNRRAALTLTSIKSKSGNTWASSAKPCCPWTRRKRVPASRAVVQTTLVESKSRSSNWWIKSDSRPRLGSVETVGSCSGLGLDQGSLDYSPACQREFLRVNFKSGSG